MFINYDDKCILCIEYASQTWILLNDDILIDNSDNTLFSNHIDLNGRIDIYNYYTVIGIINELKSTLLGTIINTSIDNMIESYDDTMNNIAFMIFIRF